MLIQAGLELCLSRPRAKGEVEAPYLLIPTNVRNWFLLYLGQRVPAQTSIYWHHSEMETLQAKHTHALTILWWDFPFVFSIYKHTHRRFTTPLSDPTVLTLVIPNKQNKWEELNYTDILCEWPYLAFNLANSDAAWLKHSSNGKSLSADSLQSDQFIRTLSARVVRSLFWPTQPWNTPLCWKIHHITCH